MASRELSKNVRVVCFFEELSKTESLFFTVSRSLAFFNYTASVYNVIMDAIEAFSRELGSLEMLLLWRSAGSKKNSASNQQRPGELKESLFFGQALSVCSSRLSVRGPWLGSTLRKKISVTWPRCRERKRVCHGESVYIVEKDLEESVGPAAGELRRGWPRSSGGRSACPASSTSSSRPGLSPEKNMINSPCSFVSASSIGTCDSLSSHCCDMASSFCARSLLSGSGGKERSLASASVRRSK